MIAKEKNFDQAISELGQADQQNPYVLYKIAVAHQGKGDQAKATEDVQAGGRVVQPAYAGLRVHQGEGEGAAAPRSTS